MNTLLLFKADYLGEEWLATSVAIAITYVVFIMGLPALIFQTFIPDAYRSIYNERFGAKWNRFFLVQICLIGVLFVQSSKIVCDIEDEKIQLPEWIMFCLIIIITLFILVKGYQHLRNNFQSTKNIEEELSKKIVSDAIVYYEKYKKINKKDIDDLTVLAKALAAGIKKKTFLESCEELLEYLLNHPENKDTKLICDLLDNVICLSVTYDGANFNHENIEKVMDILILAYSKSVGNSYQKEVPHTYLKSTIANCIKGIAIKAMFKKDLASVMDAVEKLTVIEGAENEMYVLGSEALQYGHIQTTVAVIKKLTGKLQGVALYDEGLSSAQKRIFSYWLGLIAKIYKLDGAARDFAERQINNVLQNLSDSASKDLSTFFGDTCKHFYQQADFQTIDAVKALEAARFQSDMTPH